MTRISFDGIKLLLVEDSAIIALDVQLLLEDTGAIVTTASTVSEALDLIAQDQPDLAILDVNLVAENSLPVAHKLRELGIAFIFTTGYGEAAALPDELADAPVVAKPCKGPKLLAALAEAARPKIARA